MRSHQTNTFKHAGMARKIGISPSRDHEKTVRLRSFRAHFIPFFLVRQPASESHRQVPFKFKRFTYSKNKQRVNSVPQQLDLDLSIKKWRLQTSVRFNTKKWPRSPLDVSSRFTLRANKLAWGETYLANYNAISAFFWFNIPLRLMQVYRHFGSSRVHEIADYVKIVQTAAVLELIHSATGMKLT